MKRKHHHSEDGTEEQYCITRIVESQITETVSSTKRGKLSEKQQSKLPERGSDVVDLFGSGLLEPENVARLAKEYAESGPYKHGIIRGLVDDELLHKVRNEISNELHFSLRETDIYKLNQTGDLANLSGLNDNEVKRLPAVLQLRNGLYSNVFRKFVMAVTGCGPLSGSKQDMSVTLYSQGCHLLNHDDVIGTRRVSYILYLPDPSEEWKPEYGGALRLFPTIYPNVPAPDPSVEYPPQWNQFAFFTVQPGHSFHDVEEVYVDKPRYAISGWFHIPQVGESGYTPQDNNNNNDDDDDDDDEGEKLYREAAIHGASYAPMQAQSSMAQSTLEALVGNKGGENNDDLYRFERPQLEFTQLPPSEDVLTNQDILFLSKYLNPILLTRNAIEKLQDYFAKTSHLEIKQIFTKKFAKKLFKQMEKLDDASSLPSCAKNVKPPWDIARPPHKHRYLYLQSSSDGGGDDDNDDYLNEITQLIGHRPEFVKWISLITGVDNIEKSRVLARRFRPGLDYTLASQQEKGQMLELTLGITPSAATNTKDSSWSHDVGGYQVYLRDPGTESTDPAIYLDPNVRKLIAREQRANYDMDSNNSDYDDDDDDSGSSSSSDDDDDDDDDDDGVLVSNLPSWNSLTLILRDPGVLKFVKYTSKLAPGSRFDIVADYTFQPFESQSDDDSSHQLLDDSDSFDDDDDDDDDDSDYGSS